MAEPRACALPAHFAFLCGRHRGGNGGRQADRDSRAAPAGAPFSPNGTLPAHRSSGSGEDGRERRPITGMRGTDCRNSTRNERPVAIRQPVIQQGGVWPTQGQGGAPLGGDEERPESAVHQSEEHTSELQSPMYLVRRLL